MLSPDKDKSTATFSKLQSHERINKASNFVNPRKKLCERFCVSVCKMAHDWVAGNVGMTVG